MEERENELLTRVGPGTPMGELLRRYWWPVWFSEQVRDKPVPVRLLGEDLVLFRAASGTAAAVERYCAHRRASLEFGRVEADGIRCCYHGWKYDASGQCIDTPLEPADSRLKDGVCLKAAALAEAAGLVFAYLGPAPAPPLPRWDMLVRAAGLTRVGADEEHCNWLQRAENAVDPLHLSVLHAAVYPGIAMKRAAAEYDDTWYGQRIAMHAGEKEPRVVHFLFPGHNRFTQARVGQTPSHNLRIRVPTDDTKTTTFWVTSYPSVKNEGRLETKGLKPTVRGVYDRAPDGWWDIPSHEQDRVAQESQGLITNRAQETLATSDRGIALFRRMLHKALQDVAEGRDPPGVRRGAKAGEIVDFDASMEVLGALTA